MERIEEKRIVYSKTKREDIGITNFKGIVTTEVLAALEVILVTALFIILLTLFGISFADVLDIVASAVNSIKDFIVNLIL